MESKMAELKDQNDHQRALLDALTAELMSTQEYNATAKEEAKQMKRNHDEFKESMGNEVAELKRMIQELQKDRPEKSQGTIDLYRNWMYLNKIRNYDV